LSRIEGGEIGFQAQAISRAFLPCEASGAQKNATDLPPGNQWGGQRRLYLTISESLLRRADEMID
jgi:hypothetical protein